MVLIIDGHNYRFEIENICRLFLPRERITVTDKPGAYSDSPIIAVSCLTDNLHEWVLKTELTFYKQKESVIERVSKDNQDNEVDLELKLAVQLYNLFAKVLSFTLPWGAVTGVRPVKLMRKLIAQQGEREAIRWFCEELLVSREKTDFCLETLQAENPILALSRPNSFSLYISIPFCPSRCDYCSFVSHTVECAAKLIPEYVERLCREIEYTGEIARRLGLHLETVYMGGGTPTAINSEQLTRIFDAVKNSFDLSYLREYTVEAGRPDTVTEDKLVAIKNAGVTRISINPQTLNDNVLAAIGRRHTAERFYQAFSLAREIGFGNINTDLIAGLPEDTYEGFNRSLDGIFSLSPESVTVHTLAMKRASNIVKNNREDYENGRQTVRMVDSSISRLREQGYHPYYLYRQSRTLGGTENTGWSKPGYEGLYNVFIMDETHTILACGAGGVTKLRRPGTEYIERIFNYKFPYEYNGRFADMIQRKGRVISFYETLFQKTQN